MTEIETMFKRAAERFVNKVEAGEAHSVETYTELKRCLEALAEREIHDPQGYPTAKELLFKGDR